MLRGIFMQRNDLWAAGFLFLLSILLFIQRGWEGFTAFWVSIATIVVVFVLVICFFGGSYCLLRNIKVSPACLIGVLLVGLIGLDDLIPAAIEAVGTVVQSDNLVLAIVAIILLLVSSRIYKDRAEITHMINEFWNRNRNQTKTRSRDQDEPGE